MFHNNKNNNSKMKILLIITEATESKHFKIYTKEMKREIITQGSS